MRNKKNYIALWLSLLLMMPLAYQSWHILHHHHSPVNNIPAESIEIQNAVVECLICSFEFVTCNLPNEEPIIFDYLNFQEFILYGYTALLNNPPLSTSLRAPPPVS